MVQVIGSNRQKAPTFAESIGLGLSQGATNALQQYQQMKQQQQQAQQESGNEMRKLAYESSLRGQESENKFQREAGLKREMFEKESALKNQQLAGKEYQEKIQPLQGALSVVDEMRNIRSKNNIGRGSSITGFFGGETAKDRGEYETLGNSLIQYASSIPIRNRLEFEKLAGRISDPSTTDAEAEGILNAMQRIIQNSLSVYQGNETSPQDKFPGIGKIEGQSKNKPKLSSFWE